MTALRALCAAALLSGSALSGPLAADEAKKDAGPATGIPEISIATSLPAQGDPTGVRAALAQRGITGGVNYYGEVFGNVSGGIKRGALYDGRLELFTDIDFDKLAGWKGLTFHANGYQIHGEGLSTHNIGNLFPVSFIEATPATRLFELWFEQQLAGDKLTVRFGQIASDSEFIVADTATQFINSTFGWPSSFAASLPNGGPVYPLATPGVRVQFAPTDALTLRAALFNGDPAGPRCHGDPQRCNDHGLEFRMQDPPFAIAELQFKYNHEKGSGGLAGVIKVGGWTHFGSFGDLHFDTAGRSLADPASNGVPLQHRRDHAIYALIDQTIYASGGKTVSAMARFTGSPGDRNLIDAYGDAALKFSGFIPGRSSDTFGIGGAYGRISGRAQDRDSDAISAGLLNVRRDYEALVEASYTGVIVPGWSLQPDFQYIWHPGGHIEGTDGKALKDAAVFGLRTYVSY